MIRTGSVWVQGATGETEEKNKHKEKQNKAKLMLSCCGQGLSALSPCSPSRTRKAGGPGGSEQGGKKDFTLLTSHSQARLTYSRHKLNKSVSQDNDVSVKVP